MKLDNPAESAVDGDAEATGEIKAKPFREILPPDFPDVSYGPFERNRLDFWQAKGDRPRPVLVWIHGGGWLRGGKNQVPRDLSEFLNSGVSVAIINYRLVDEHTMLPAPVHDAARAIQFLRHKAVEWNIDTARLAAMGTSAGACTAMWLLFHDDLADPKADDPVLRESTRLTAVAAEQGQTLLDPTLLIPILGERGSSHPMLYRSFGFDSLEEALAGYDDRADLYREFSPITHVSPGDPPLFLNYPRSPKLPAENSGHGIHHPVFGVKMKEACDKAGVECHLVVEGEIQGSAEGTKPYKNSFDFLKAKLAPLPPRQ